MPASTGFRGPLRHVHRATTPFGTNPPGGPTSVGATMPYLAGCSLEYVDELPFLPYGNIDDQPRQYGWAWSGNQFPGGYATSQNFSGLTTTLTASMTDSTLLGGGLVSTTSGAATAQQLIKGANNMAVQAGKKIFFEVRFRCATPTSTAYLLGLFDSVPADITGALGSTNGIFFLKPLAGNEFSANVRAAGTSTQVAGAIAATGLVPATAFG